MKNKMDIITDDGVVIEVTVDTRGDTSMRWNALEIGVWPYTDTNMSSKIDLNNITSEDLEKMSRMFKSLAKATKVVEDKIADAVKLQDELS